MTDNPWAAWLREQEGAQVLPGGAGAAGPASVDGDGEGDEFRGGPFGWNLAPQPQRPRRRLLLAAVALWVLLLLAALAVLTRPTSVSEEIEMDGGGDAGAAAASPTEAMAVNEGGAAGPIGRGVGGAGDEEEAGEVGALLVRAALGAPSGSAGAARYVDAAVATGVEPAGDAQVVTVLALVLTGDGQGWDAATVERHAVAVVRDPSGSYSAVAGPWPLAPLAVAVAPTGTPETDPERLALAAAAIEGAGYRDLADLSLLHDAAHPGVLTARATAVAPGATEPSPWTLWLRDTDAPTLLGTD